ncbi:MAG TPA: TraR/DksA family transcriptional regulator [Steroidobacteraceae bacterium]|nr:TraR/DksA family transcriptional regulator [Steroidobacteraceae bacterium]
MSRTRPATLTSAEIFRCARVLRRDREQWVLRLMHAGSPATLFSVNHEPAVADSQDSAVQEELEGTRNAQIGRLSARLAQIDAALQRIEHGRYGICQSCGGPIGAERLQVEPRAPRCRHCQETQENKKTITPRRDVP